jgi:hypothetical protein
MGWSMSSRTAATRVMVSARQQRHDVERSSGHPSRSVAGRYVDVRTERGPTAPALHVARQVR